MKHFKNKLVSGKAVGAQSTLAEDLNKVFEILENIEGIGGVSVTKKGTLWRICMGGDEPDGDSDPVTPGGGSSSGGVPTGYADGTVITAIQFDTSTKQIQIKTATALVKDSTESGWTEAITPAAFAD